MHRHLTRSAALCLLGTLATACGGGGGSGGGAVGAAIGLALDLATPVVFEGDTLTLRGSATAAAPLVDVSIDGTPAVTSDGFASFALPVALAPGENLFDVVARDALGRAATLRSARIVRETPILVGVGGCAVDPKGSGRVVVSTLQPDSLVLLDGATAERALLSGPTRGAGTAFTDLHNCTWTADGTRILVAAGNPGRIFVVDAVTGDRTAFGRSSSFTYGLAHDPVRERAVYTDQFFASLVRFVPLGGGADTILSDGADGKLPALQDPGAVAYDADEDRYLVVDISQRVLLAVDADSGGRKLISDFTDANQGPTASFPGGLALDDAARLAWVADVTTLDLYEIDLTTGRRKIVLPADPALGPPLIGASSIQRDPATGRLVAADVACVLEVDRVAQTRTRRGDVRVGGSGFSVNTPFVIQDRARGRLVLLAQNGELDTLDLATGARTRLPFAGAFFMDVEPDRAGDEWLALDASQDRLLFLDPVTLAFSEASGPARGAGPPFSVRFRVVLAEELDRAFVIDSFNRRLVAVDLATGDRSVLAQAGDGQAVPVGFLFDLAWDPVGGRLLVIDDSHPGLVRIDPASGARELFADDARAGQPDVPSGSVAIDADARALYVVDFAGGLVRVDLDDGSRTSVASAAVGRGSPLREPRTLAIEPGTDRAWLIERSLGALLQLDLASGDRAIIAR